MCAYTYIHIHIYIYNVPVGKNYTHTHIHTHARVNKYTCTRITLRVHSMYAWRSLYTWITLKWAPEIQTLTQCTHNLHCWTSKCIKFTQREVSTDHSQTTSEHTIVDSTEKGTRRCWHFVNANALRAQGEHTLSNIPRFSCWTSVCWWTLRTEFIRVRNLFEQVHLRLPVKLLFWTEFWSQSITLQSKILSMLPIYLFLI